MSEEEWCRVAGGPTGMDTDFIGAGLDMGGRSVSFWNMKQPIDDILTWHEAAYPGMNADDYYKLAYQRVCGVGHLLGEGHASETAVVGAMRRELEHEYPGHENILDPLDDKTGLVRLNLRPLSRLKPNLRRLARALIATAGAVRGTPAKLRRELERIERRLTLRRPELAAEFAELVPAARDDIPLRHHSPEYRRAYRPVYRVVLQKLIPDCLGATGRARFENRLKYDERIAWFRQLGYDIPAARAGIVRLARPLGRSVLEVGTGNGSLTIHLARSRVRLATVDTDAAAQEIARMNLKNEAPGARVRFVQADAARLPFRDRSFDTVVSAYSFHHFIEPERTLGEMARVAAQKIVLADFNQAGFAVVRALHRSEGRRHQEPGGDPERARDILTGLGFKIQRVDTGHETVFVARR